MNKSVKNCIILLNKSISNDFSYVLADEVVSKKRRLKKMLWYG